MTFELVRTFTNRDTTKYRYLWRYRSGMQISLVYDFALSNFQLELIGSVLK